MGGEFKEISTKIFQLYKKALQVELVDAGGGRKELVLKKQKEGRKKKLDAIDMAYLKESRDFCVSNGDLPGTKGRQCGHKYDEVFSRKVYENVTAVNECHHLCCGRGYIITEKAVGVKCGCKFDMKIMNTKCYECDSTKKMYFCK